MSGKATRHDSGRQAGVGQGAFDGTSTAVALNEPGTLAARTLTFPTPKYLFVVYDLAAGAAGQTIKSRVTAVDVAAGDTGASGLALDSHELLIAAAPADGCIGLGSPRTSATRP